MNVKKLSVTLLLLVSQLMIMSASVGEAFANHSHKASDKALQRAAATNKVAEVRHLLKEGANPSAIVQDKNRRSALILAVAGGHIEVVKLLLLSGADVNYKDNSGLTALNWTAMRQKNAVASQLLLFHADVNTRDHNGITPLMYAVGTNNSELLRLLAASGANLNAVSSATKMTPLLIAVEQANMRFLLMLLDLDADVNGTNHEGYSPLMAAAGSGQVNILTKLINRGASSVIQDARGMMALDYAQQHRHTSAIQFLEALQNN